MIRKEGRRFQSSLREYRNAVSFLLPISTSVRSCLEGWLCGVGTQGSFSLSWHSSRAASKGFVFLSAISTSEVKLLVIVSHLFAEAALWSGEYLSEDQLCVLQSCAGVTAWELGLWKINPPSEKLFNSFHARIPMFSLSIPVLLWEGMFTYKDGWKIRSTLSK